MCVCETFKAEGWYTSCDVTNTSLVTHWIFRKLCRLFVFLVNAVIPRVYALNQSSCVCFRSQAVTCVRFKTLGGIRVISATMNCNVWENPQRYVAVFQTAGRHSGDLISLRAKDEDENAEVLQHCVVRSSFSDRKRFPTNIKTPVHNYRSETGIRSV